MHRAVEWAERDAPLYYTRHVDDRLLAADGTLNLAVAGQLVNDHDEWTRTGKLSHETAVREWARHLGRAELDPPAGEHPTAAQLRELEKTWKIKSAPVAKLTVGKAQEFAAEHAPPYYRRHVDERLHGSDARAELLTDMTALRDRGAIPLCSRHEEWARWSGENLEGVDEAERTARLEEAWAAGVDERGALELEQLRQASSTQEISGVSERTATMDEQLRAAYAQHLDPEVAREISQEDLARSWQAASIPATSNPGDQAAAEQLHRQFVARFGTDPGQWASEQQNAAPGQGRDWLLVDVLADQAAEYGDRIDAAKGPTPGSWTRGVITQQVAA